MSEKVCNQCGYASSDDALFCPSCGNSLRAPGTDPLIDTVIAERYKLLEKIGSGGSGTIYRGEHANLRKKVAVKVLHQAMSSDEGALERFRNEASTIGELDNEHLLQVQDFGRIADGRLFFAMEFLEGESLRAVLDRDVRLPIARALDILTQTSEALMEAHALGYVHRDLRPRNVFLITKRGRKDFVKLLDFGLAKLINPETGSGTMSFGDPRYVAPEQARGETVDRRGDVYSLGVLAYEMLTGMLPFVGANPGEILQRAMGAERPSVKAQRSDCPDWLDQVVARCMAARPEERFVTVLRLLECLNGKVAPPMLTPAAVSSVTRDAEKAKAERAASDAAAKASADKAAAEGAAAKKLAAEKAATEKAAAEKAEKAAAEKAATEKAAAEKAAAEKAATEKAAAAKVAEEKAATEKAAAARVAEEKAAAEKAAARVAEEQAATEKAAAQKSAADKAAADKKAAEAAEAAKDEKKRTETSVALAAATPIGLASLMGNAKPMGAATRPSNGAAASTSKTSTPGQAPKIEARPATPAQAPKVESKTLTPAQVPKVESKTLTPAQTSSVEVKVQTPAQTSKVDSRKSKKQLKQEKRDAERRGGAGASVKSGGSSDEQTGVVARPSGTPARVAAVSTDGAAMDVRSANDDMKAVAAALATGASGDTDAASASVAGGGHDQSAGLHEPSSPGLDPKWFDADASTALSDDEVYEPHSRRNIGLIAGVGVVVVIVVGVLTIALWPRAPKQEGLRREEPRPPRVSDVVSAPAPTAPAATPPATPSPVAATPVPPAAPTPPPATPVPAVAAPATPPAAAVTPPPAVVAPPPAPTPSKPVAAVDKKVADPVKPVAKSVEPTVKATTPAPPPEKKVAEPAKAAAAPAPVSAKAAPAGAAGEVDALVKAGRAKLDAGDYGAAAAQFTKAHQVDAKNADAVFGLGECFFEQGDFVGAAIQLKQASALAPRKSRYVVRLGQAYYKMGKLKEAVGEYKRALKMEPKNQEAQESLQLAESKLNATDK